MEMVSIPKKEKLKTQDEKRKEAEAEIEEVLVDLRAGNVRRVR